MLITMKKYIFIAVTMLASNMVFCSTYGKNQEKLVIDLVYSFLEHLVEIKPNTSQHYMSRIEIEYLSSYWKFKAPKEGSADIELGNMYFVSLSELQNGKTLQVKIKDNVACVFIQKNKIIGAFSLINENGWKFMAPTLYFPDQDIPKVCSALGFELNIRNDDLIYLKQNK